MISKLRTGAIALASMLLIMPSLSSTSFAQGHGRGHHGGGGGGAVVRGGGGGGGGGGAFIRGGGGGGGGLQFNRGSTYTAPSFNRGYVAPRHVQHRNFYHRHNYYYPRHRYRHSYSYSPFLFLGGPRYYVRSYGPGWCRGLHRGRHWAPRIGWHSGLHRGLFRCY